MTIEQLMTRGVITVHADTSLKDVAATLVEQGISGVPVCGKDGRVLGVVSEGDLLFKEQGIESRKGNARTAGEAMSAPAVTIEPHRSVSLAARLMLQRSVNRLPVVRDGVLVGIVTRADLIRAFDRPDDELELELREEVMQRVLWIDPDRVTVTVNEGEVRLGGELDSKTDAELLVAYAYAVPGVVGVESELTWSIDDQSRRVRHARIPGRI
jgi:CBS domain-containing protein